MDNIDLQFLLALVQRATYFGLQEATVAVVIADKLRKAISGTDLPPSAQ